MNHVFQLRDGWKVMFNGRVCSPTWPPGIEGRGPAQAYLDALVEGRRKPEYHEQQPVWPAKQARRRADKKGER